MHTGRGDAAQRAKTRARIPVAVDASDAACGFCVGPDFERFSQVDDVFSRSRYDPDVHTDKAETFYATYRRPLADWRAAKGYQQNDYAFRNATWHVADVFAEMYEADDRRDGFLDPLSMLRDGAAEQVDLGSPEQAAARIKHAAHAAGADLVGIAAYDDRWTYTERFSVQAGGPKPNDLPDGLDQVIVIGQAMDSTLIETAPSALSGAATGMGYSQDAVVLLTVAQYLRNLGYRAVPSMNDTALAVPYAVQAGLGEYGKHGLVITPEFGTSVRFGKIFTDAPLAHDRPISFGVREMCEICNACSKGCPSKAIPDGPPTTERHNRSNLVGVKKWTIDGERCFAYWTRINSDCSICVRVCPFTRDYTRRRNRAWLRLAGSRLRRLALWLDRREGRGARRQSDEWWPDA
ncbi:MAG: 4Fe-4S dicluster domain-containing protein [Actinobacteria bacterium]|nr:4Fe-4S dicluster domain-containing protein [Actinomycetota bacterium]